MRGIVLGCPISTEMHDKGHRLQHAARATAVVGCLLLSTAVASSSGGAHTRRVTGATPFRDACGLRPRPVRSSEGEPSIAVSPRDPRRIIIGYQQDRFREGGGSLSDVLAVSRDGGRRWRRTLLPGVSRCTGSRRWERVSDVSVSFGADGTAYASTLPL